VAELEEARIQGNRGLSTMHMVEAEPVIDDVDPA
jgi:hypothetical protein